MIICVDIVIDYADCGHGVGVVVDYANTTLTMRTQCRVVVDYANTTLTMRTQCCVVVDYANTILTMRTSMANFGSLWLPLMGQCHEIFELFLQPGPHMNRQKRFRELFPFSLLMFQKLHVRVDNYCTDKQIFL